MFVPETPCSRRPCRAESHRLHRVSGPSGCWLFPYQRKINKIKNTYFHIQKIDYDQYKIVNFTTVINWIVLRCIVVPDLAARWLCYTWWQCCVWSCPARWVGWPSAWTRCGDLSTQYKKSAQMHCWKLLFYISVKIECITKVWSRISVLHHPLKLLETPQPTVHILQKISEVPQKVTASGIFVLHPL